ncbi:MAG: hypothetical protein GX222_07850 [Ruminococcaceae bacterium]|nr:hypothetical protein [Oscillospiraceae bacterium]
MPKITGNITAPRVSKRKFNIEYFGGVDLSNQPANVDIKRSCDGMNMIRDLPGKIRKRTGYKLLKQYPSKINGIYFFKGMKVIHSGTKIFYDDVEKYSSANDVKSYAIQLGDYLYILDGLKLLRCADTAIEPAENHAYIPTVTIGKEPAGAGTTYEPVNMLSDKRRDSFLGEASVTVYQLSFNGLSGDTVTAQVQNSQGVWVDKTEGTDFSVNRTTGTVTFTTAPGAPPVTGEDNVKITYSVVNNDYRQKVNGCKFGISYGLNGNADRLFISGNPNCPNIDFYSERNDGTYFGDIRYGEVGQKKSKIMGYSIINKHLATHKENDDDERNIYLRYGELPEAQNNPDEPLTNKLGAYFRITDIIQGEGAISNHAFGYVKEPIFLTAKGISAAAPMEYLSERYIQNRSAYIDMALLKEPNLNEAYACVYKDFYMLAINGKVYILDTIDLSYEKRSAGRFIYEAYIWDNIPARVIASDGEVIYFGTTDGHLMEFFTADNSLASYMDGVGVLGENLEGLPIKARWEFDFSGDDFYKNKTISYLALRLAPAMATSVKISAKVSNREVVLGDLGAMARYFSFSGLAFSKFAFSGDTNPRTIGRKIKIKKTDSVRFTFKNEQAKEPFGIYGIALEFIERGNIRR